MRRRFDERRAAPDPNIVEKSAFAFDFASRGP